MVTKLTNGKSVALHNIAEVPKVERENFKTLFLPVNFVNILEKILNSYFPNLLKNLAEWEI